MKLATFAVRDEVSFGCVTDRGVIDLPRHFPGRWTDAKAFLADGAATPEPVSGLAPDHGLGDVELLPPIPDPGKIVCVATNYFEDAAAGKPVPEHPLLFLRVAASQTGHGQPLVKPKESDRLDFEGELAVVIGRSGRRIDRGDAYGHVAGYACYNDGTVRDWQKHSSQFTAGKNFFRTGAFGPWIVTADEAGDVSDLDLQTRVNGVVKQRTNTGRMIFDIPFLVSYISTFIPLEPGDVIVSGTPGGFGSTRTPPEFLRPGDIVEVEIERIGTLSNTVAAE